MEKKRGKKEGKMGENSDFFPQFYKYPVGKIQWEQKSDFWRKKNEFLQKKNRISG